MSPLAFAVFAIDPAAMIPAAAPEATEAPFEDSPFAELLAQADEPEPDSIPPSPLSFVKPPSIPELPADLPQTEEAQDEVENIDVAANTYALVAAIPVLPQEVKSQAPMQPAPAAPAAPEYFAKRTEAAVPQPAENVTEGGRPAAEKARTLKAAPQIDESQPEPSAGLEPFIEEPLPAEPVAEQFLPTKSPSQPVAQESLPVLPMTTPAPESKAAKQPVTIKHEMEAAPLTPVEAQEVEAATPAPQQAHPAFEASPIETTAPVQTSKPPKDQGPLILKAQIAPKQVDEPRTSAPVQQAERTEFNRDRPDDAPASGPPEALTEVASAAPIRFETPDTGQPDPQQAPSLPQSPPPVRPAPLTRIAEPEAPRHIYTIPEAKAGTPPAQPAPLKQFDIRIPNESGGVTVRVQERAGSVEVSVRSSDAQIASSVSETLPDLVQQLDQQGFNAETWTPAGEADLPRHNSENHQDDHRKPGWDESPRRRPKHKPTEDFKEHLS